MSKIVQFGESVPGYSIPVLNEREIRASAGILFFFTFLSLMQIIYKGNFVMIKYVIILFLADFIIRVFINPKYAPTLIIGRLIVNRQNPEYVGAAQKKFAWVIGVVLAATMFILMVIVNSYSIITGLVCLICLIFLFFEAVFGICIGCWFYKIVKKEKAQYCPGEICDIKTKQDIQKTTWSQFVIVIFFIGFTVFLAYTLNDFLSLKPQDLWQILKL